VYKADGISLGPHSNQGYTSLHSSAVVGLNCAARCTIVGKTLIAVLISQGLTAGVEGHEFESQLDPESFPGSALLSPQIKKIIRPYQYALHAPMNPVVIILVWGQSQTFNIDSCIQHNFSRVGDCLALD
jgi:hypothetical protein